MIIRVIQAVGGDACLLIALPNLQHTISQFCVVFTWRQFRMSINLCGIKSLSTVSEAVHILKGSNVLFMVQLVGGRWFVCCVEGVYFSECLLFDVLSHY